MINPIPGDDHYLALTFIISLALQSVCFFVAYTFQFDKITDFAGSTNFILVALLALFGGAASAPAGGGAATYSFAPRAVSMVTILCIARAELALYLLSRVLKRGKDDRFDAMRGHFASFATFWLIQALWAWGVSLAVVFVATDAAAGVPLDGRDGAGAALAVAGFLLEVWADLVKDRFRSDPANAGRVCDVGPWAWSRHPNFFGEIALWWGLWLHGVPVYEASGRAGAGYYTLASPLLTMVLLLFLSGMPTAEGVHQRRFLRTPGAKAAYLAYRARTSPLVPLPPALYRPLPLWLKRAALLELRMYETDWDWTPGTASTANPASGVGGGGGGGGGDAVAGKDTALLAGGAGGPDGGYGAAR